MVTWVAPLDHSLARPVADFCEIVSGNKSAPESLQTVSNLSVRRRLTAIGALRACMLRTGADAGFAGGGGAQMDVRAQWGACVLKVMLDEMVAGCSRGVFSPEDASESADLQWGHESTVTLWPVHPCTLNGVQAASVAMVTLVVQQGPWFCASSPESCSSCCSSP